MISKELLSAVLGVEVTNVRDTMYDNELRFVTPDEELRRKFSPYVPKINIYELAHKCKEWALSKGYYLHSHIKEDNECWCIVKSLDNITRQFSCEMDTESEAIIKACEWILNSKDSK